MDDLEGRLLRKIYIEVGIMEASVERRFIGIFGPEPEGNQSESLFCTLDSVRSTQGSGAGRWIT